MRLWGWDAGGGLEAGGGGLAVKRQLSVENHAVLEELTTPVAGYVRASET